jgi:dihydrodipicolinate synthase/N-acetylneuraminate lyase
MKPLTAIETKGTYATLLLPIRPDDSIDIELLNRELDYLLQSGVDGIYSNGTAGEFYSQSEAEFVEVNELLASRCESAGMRFQIGASFPTPQMSLKLSKLAASFRPGAIQVTLPDWYPPVIPEIIAFLDRVSEATAPIPLILYNPPHAKRIVTPEEYALLCERLPALIGVKVGGGDEHWYRRMEPLKSRLSIFVPGHTLATGYDLGAAGSYSNVACLQPVGAKRWNDLMRSDWAAARRIEVQIQQFMTQHILPFRDLGFSNMALDKLLSSVGNWAAIGTRLRWPYFGIDNADLVYLRAQARQQIPFLFESSPGSWENDARPA